MKVAHLTNCYTPGRQNGVTIAVKSYVDGLKQLECDAFIVAPDYGVENDTLRVKTSFFQGYSFNCSLDEKILQELDNTDVLHIHHPPFGIYSKGTLTRQAFDFAKKNNKKTVFHNHTRYDLYALAYVPLGGLVQLDDFFRKKNVQYCNESDLVISPSNSMKELLLEWGVKSRIEVVPTNIKAKNFSGDREIIRKKYGIKKDEFVFLYLGRLGKEKNVENLFKTLKDMPVRLLVVGDGPLRKKLKRKVDGIFVGQVPYDEIKDYYAAADLYGTLSYSDTQSLVIQEAKASGLPVIAINAVGNKDSIRNGIDGYLVNSEHEFRVRVWQLMVHIGFLKKLGENARDSIKEEDDSNAAKRLYELYSELKQ